MTELTLETDLTADQRDFVTTVKQSADSLLTIINDILDFSRIEAGKMDLLSMSFDVRETIGDTLKLLSATAIQKHIDLKLDVSPSVPACLLGDAVRLQQILVNLVGNAIKFTSKNGAVSITVLELEQSADGATLHFEILDTGIGIPANKRELIFRAFSQADGSITRQFGGTGLGLTISARLVEMMGGSIWVESLEGVGSTFHFNARFGRVGGECTRG